MRKVDIIGADMTSFGRHIKTPLVELGGKAAIGAIKNAGIEPSQINIGFFANMQAGNITGEFTVGQNILWEAGVNRIPVFNVENACTRFFSVQFSLVKHCFRTVRYSHSCRSRKIGSTQSWLTAIRCN